MSNNLDFVIKTLETELESIGIDNENSGKKPVINNYLNDLSGKQQIINGGTSMNMKELNINNLQKSQKFLRNRNEERQIKEYIENCLYNMFMPLKTDLKSSLENINFKVVNLEKELLKINNLNENIRTLTSKFSKLENDYRLLSSNFNSIKSLSIQNKENLENLDKNIKTHIDKSNTNFFKLKDEMNNILNNQKLFQNKNNFAQVNNISSNNEKKIIEKINDLYKEKEKNISILSNNLFSKINDYSIQSDKKLEIIYNSINEIKQRLDNADNNVNLLNDLPSIKEITENNNKEIESIKSKMETISNAADIKNCKEEVENTKNDIQLIKTDIEEIIKLRNENKNLNIELNNMKKNTNLLEKKINTMEGNFFNLDTEINDNKKEIIQIKKERNEYKANLKSISVNDNHSINEKLNKLIYIIFFII